MGNSFFLSSCGIVIFRFLDGPVQGLGQVSSLIFQQFGSAMFCNSSGLEIGREILGDETRKSNSWCNSRYNPCRTSDRGRATMLERHVETQTMSEWR